MITNTYVEDGDIVYGEFKSGDAKKSADELMGKCQVDFSLLDKELNAIILLYSFSQEEDKYTPPP